MDILLTGWKQACEQYQEIASLSLLESYENEQILFYMSKKEQRKRDNMLF